MAAFSVASSAYDHKALGQVCEICGPHASLGDRTAALRFNATSYLVPRSHLINGITKQ